jgi:hypothetical protein
MDEKKPSGDCRQPDGLGANGNKQQCSANIAVTVRSPRLTELQGNNRTRATGL